MQKFMQYPKQYARIIQEERQRIGKMQGELEMDMAIRNLILNQNQMICIPSDQGLTGAAFCKAKTVYYNNFEGVTQSYFYPECDNLKSFKNITNFMMAPIVGHDGKPNGVLQLYSFSQPISRLQVKKFIAMRKFIGGCLENVTLNNNNLEAVVGAMTKVNSTMSSIETREQNAEANYR